MVEEEDDEANKPTVNVHFPAGTLKSISLLAVWVLGTQCTAPTQSSQMGKESFNFGRKKKKLVVSPNMKNLTRPWLDLILNPQCWVYVE